MLKRNYFLIILIIVNIKLTIGQNCVINLDKMTEFPPVIVYNTQLIYSDSAQYSVPNMNRVTLACSGDKNTFRGSSVKTIVLQCERGTFKYQNKPFVVENAKCKNYPKVKVEDGISCLPAENGKVKQVNFEVDSTYSVNVYTTCYKPTTYESMYTKQVMQGKYSQPNKRCDFRDDGSEGGYKEIKKLYDNQRAALSSILGKQSTTYCPATAKTCLARGHFAPCEAFSFITSSRASFLYVNAAPQWQRANTANWKRVELRISRVMSDGKRTKLTVYTGSSADVQELKDDYNVLQPIYLGNFAAKQLPVPKYFWKAVITDRNEGIVFIQLANPFADSCADLGTLCTNVCQVNGWYVKEFDDKTKGCITCCDINDVKAMKKLPRMDDVPSVARVFMAP